MLCTLPFPCLLVYSSHHLCPCTTVHTCKRFLNIPKGLYFVDIIFYVIVSIKYNLDYQSKRNKNLFVQVSDPWFPLYVFLFIGAYAKDFLDYVMNGSTFKRWWNRQRIWLILGCSSYPFSIVDWLLTSLGMSTFEFNVTSKVSDSEISKRYEEGVFEFGVESPLLLSVNIVAVLNLFAFSIGIKHVLINAGTFEELFVQLFITGFAVLNSWPLYEGMILRSDKGKMPPKTTLKSVCVVLVIYLAFF